ncbi:MAG: ATP-binding protein [Saccharofermentans sp.]|nr:ATP-binding protein [Saccharofermentans sp.]
MSKLHEINTEERNDYLIRKKIVKYMLTGVMTTVALQLGNVVDAMIVGNLIGSLGNGAITASTPYLYVLQAAAILLGSGGALAVAVLLGKRDIQNAGRVMAFCMMASVVYPLIISMLSPVLIPGFLQLTHAGPELGKMIKSVITVYSFGMPILSFVMVMAYLINVDNNPSVSAAIHITANVVNLTLDFILVKFTPLGMTGAALSTILGYFVAGVIFIPMYIKSPNRMVKISFRGAFKNIPLIQTTIKNGLPNLYFLIMTVISVQIINSAVIKSLGDDYFSAYSVANNTQLIVQMFLNGISSVIASVAGVLYGEKDYYGMRRVLKRVLKTALLTGAVIMLVFLIIPKSIASLYGFKNEALLPELNSGLRIFALSFGFFILNAVSQNYYRTIGQIFLSMLSSSLELVIFKIPFMLLGLRYFGFKGLFSAIIFSELLTFAFLNLIRIILQVVGKVPQKGFMAIPEKNEGNICDITIVGNNETAVDISEKIIDYCLAEKIPRDKAQVLGIAAEELVSNIGKYGYKDNEKKYIDICLTGSGDRYYLRIRDDGIPFDPTSYEAPEHDKYKITGLELVRQIAVKMNYMRAISLNNTIIEIDCAEDGGASDE